MLSEPVGRWLCSQRAFPTRERLTLNGVGKAVPNALRRLVQGGRLVVVYRWSHRLYLLRTLAWRCYLSACGEREPGPTDRRMANTE